MTDEARRKGRHTARSLESGLVLPTQILGLFGPPKKRINFGKFNKQIINEYL